MAFPQLSIMISSEQIHCINTEQFSFPPVTSVNKSTTWENKGLITTSRHGWAQVLQVFHKHIPVPTSRLFLTDPWRLPVPLCVWPGRRETTVRGVSIVVKRD